jgi:hypothetical protein
MSLDAICTGFLDSVFLSILMTASAQFLKRWSAGKAQWQPADPARPDFSRDWSEHFYY